MLENLAITILCVASLIGVLYFAIKPILDTTDKDAKKLSHI